jgi:4-alpha-glucanotransferase
LGEESLEFIDFLARSRQSLWQLCPLGPTGFGDSPYQCFSAFAFNPLLIDVGDFIRLKWLNEGELRSLRALPRERVDFGALIPIKREILGKAHCSFMERIASPAKSGRTLKAAFEAFKRRSASWLPDYALFMALKEAFGGGPWDSWPSALKMRERGALAEAMSAHADAIAFHEFAQFIANDQWLRVRAHAQRRGVRIIGDMPIFVAYDSADVWSRPGLFMLDDERRPTKVAGVPPDYFSETGQLWGNPLYDWDAMRADGFAWWIEAIRVLVERYDYLRIDHFRGFSAFWAVPAGEPTAVKGEWLPAPGSELFAAVRDALGPLPIIAEDLGFITQDVKRLMRECGFPGMKVLQFAFDSAERNDHIPHGYSRNEVVYTGTHDNDTVVGWFESASPADRAYAEAYLGAKGGKGIHWAFIEKAMASPCAFAVFPMQDVLGLGSEARMNRPGTMGGNWTWRMPPIKGEASISERLAALTRLYGR